MRGGTNTRGYTIVEVMIFLAVSGLMFIMAAAFISGKQAKSEFMQGMNDINSKVQQVVNDVSNGFYPSPGDFACRAGASGPVTFTGTSTGQGGKLGCAFMGKVVQFGVTHPEDQGVAYSVYTVVGRQIQDSAQTTDPSSIIPPANFAGALPVVATNLTQHNDLEWGVKVYKMYMQASPADAPTEIGAVGFFSGFATATSNTLNSGAAAPLVVAIPGSALNQGETDMDGQVPQLASTPVVSNPLITVCFDGGVNEYGMLTIGTSDANVHGQRLSTHMQISAGAPAGICPHD